MTDNGWQMAEVREGKSELDFEKGIRELILP